MKHSTGIAALGFVAFAAPALAQTRVQARCDSVAATHALYRPVASGRHQVLAPRDSALPSQRLVTRRVRLADGSVRVSKYVTKSGVPVTKQKAPVCPPVPKTLGAAVGEVAPTPTPTALAPITAPGEVIPQALPIVGTRFPLPILAGLLLGGTAVAVGTHTPGTVSSPVATLPGTPTIPVIPGPPPAPGAPTTPGTPTTPGAPGTPGGPSTPVPEPATVLLVGGGLLLAGGVARRRR